MTQRLWRSLDYIHTTPKVKLKRYVPGVQKSMHTNRGYVTAFTQDIRTEKIKEITTVYEVQLYVLNTILTFYATTVALLTMKAQISLVNCYCKRMEQ